MRPSIATGLLVFVVFVAGCNGASESQRTIPMAAASSDTEHDVGDLIIRINALTTDQIAAEVAARYSDVITRASDRVMLNVSVHRKPGNEAIEAELSVKATNLTGQLKNVTLSKIQEAKAIYYIGELPVANAETINFVVTGTVDGRPEPFEVSFRRQFYTN